MGQSNLSAVRVMVERKRRLTLREWYQGKKTHLKIRTGDKGFGGKCCCLDITERSIILYSPRNGYFSNFARCLQKALVVATMFCSG
ncbi:hypothetical protein GJAV_G00262520 [Gymnothorax javanicus]|nr:hypothetical protein GJAV_G00262520 [Gymnothorax javanicus]